MAQPARLGQASALTLSWATEPDELEDDENTALQLELPSQSRLTNCLSSAIEVTLPASITPDHSLLDYRWLALILAAVAFVDFGSNIGSCCLFTGTFEPAWALALLLVLEAAQLFDEPVYSVSRLLHRLRRWRELKLSDNTLPPECTLTESGWASDVLDVGRWCFNDNYVPWVTDIYFSYNVYPDIFPLFQLWTDVGPHYVSSMVATEVFWYRTERIKSLIGLHVGHVIARDGPFTDELLTQNFASFIQGTAWTSPDVAIFSLQPSSRLLHFRMQMAGLDSNADTEFNFFREHCIQLVHSDAYPQAAKLGRRADSSGVFFMQLARLAQLYLPGRYREKLPRAMFQSVNDALTDRKHRLDALLEAQPRLSLTQIVDSLIKAKKETEDSGGSSANEVLGATTDASVASMLGASPGAGAVSTRSNALALGRPEWLSMEPKLTTLLEQQPPPSNRILATAARSNCLVLQQVLFNVGGRANIHKLCRAVHAHRVHLPHYAGQALLQGMDLSTFTDTVVQRLRAMQMPAAQVEHIVSLQILEADFIHNGKYLVAAIKNDAVVVTGNWEAEFWKPDELRASGVYGSRVLFAFGFDERSDEGFSLERFCDFIATQIEEYTPALCLDGPALNVFKGKTLTCYRDCIRFGQRAAQQILLDFPDGKALGPLIPVTDCPDMLLYKSYLKTLNTSLDFRAMSGAGGSSLQIGPPSVLSPTKTPASTGALFTSTTESMPGSAAFHITYSSTRATIYRGKEGYSVQKLSSRFPGLCHAALLSLSGNPVALCDCSFKAGHGPLGSAAHALPSNYRKLVAECWVHTYIAPRNSVQDKEDGAGTPDGERDTEGRAGASGAAEEGVTSPGRGGGRALGSGRSRGRGKGKGKGGHSKGGKGKGKGKGKWTHYSPY
jgi:hypothetical protein